MNTIITTQTHHQHQIQTNTTINNNNQEPLNKSQSATNSNSNQLESEPETNFIHSNPPDLSSKTQTDNAAKSDVRRVKVYELKGDNWLDRGTGHCIGVFDNNSSSADILPVSDELQSHEPQPSTSQKVITSNPPQSNDSEPRLEVRQEASEGSLGGQLLLRSQILRPNLFTYDGWQHKSKKAQKQHSSSSSSSSSSDDDDDDLEDDLHDEDDEEDLDHPRRKRSSTRHRPPSWPEGGGIYQRQQATLVVWTEPDGTDMALSFATAQGCQEIWSFLCGVQNFLGPSPAALLDQSSLDHAIRSRAYGPQVGHSRKDAVNWDDEDLNDPNRDTNIHGQNGGGSLGGGPLGDDDDHLTLSMDLFAHASAHHHSSSPSPAVTNLPDPTLSNIHEIEGMVKWACRSSFGRERVSSYILRRDYVKKLQQVKVEAEDLESLKDLHALCTLVHSILMLNDAAIYEYCLQDDIVLIVAGILDYDPEFGNQKASYYADLADPTRFKQVVPIKDGSIRAKIHQTYRLQYFKDIILARILDDSTFSIINSMIFFNQIDIVQYLHSNDEFMRELFGIFDQHQPDLDPVIGPPLPPSMVVSSSVSEAETMERKIDTILFIQQLSAMAKHLQPPSRVGFFRSLAERGVLKVIEFGLSKKPPIGSEQTDLLDDSAIKSAICEILITIIDYDPHSVRGYCLKQHEAKNRNLVECLIELLLAEPDLGLKVQLVEALRILLDTGAGAGPSGTAGMMMMAEGGMRREEDPENEKFLSFFYDHCFKQLSEPIHRLPEIKNGKHSTTQPMMSGIDAAMYNHLCDLFSFLITHHSFRSKYVMLTANLPAKLASLLVFDRFKFLQLGSIRFFRACLNKHDDFYNRCFVKHDIFGPVLELLERQGAKDNLVKSACLEFFENIRLTNMKPMLNHLMDRDGQKIRRLADTNGLITFKNLIVRWEQNNESPPPPPPLASSSAPPHSDEAGPLGTIRNIGNWARTRTLEPEEENYFAQDSDEEDSDSPNKLGPIAIPTIPSGVLGKHNDIMESSGRKRARSGSLIDNVPSRSGLSRSRTQSGPFLSTTKSSTGLVDYEDESEEEEVEADDVIKQEPTKRRKSAEEEKVEDVIKQEPPKRRKNAEEEEEEDGAFARLKRSNVTSSLSTSSPMIRSSGFSIQGSRNTMNTSGLSSLGGSKIVVSLSKSTVDSNGEKT